MDQLIKFMMNQMKKISVFLVLCLLTSMAQAQGGAGMPSRFTYGVELAKLSVVSDSYKNLTSSGTFVKLTAGYNYSAHLYLGLSAGLNTYKDFNSLATLPVEAEVKGVLFDKASTPVAYLKGGYSFERPNDGSYGAVYSMGVGYRIKLGARARITPILGYNHQQVHAYVAHFTENTISIGKEKADPISSIYFAVRFEL